MTRTLNRLTARSVETAKKKGMRPDGGGLYLQIGDGGPKSWIFRYKRGGKERWMGLGSAAEVSLSEARDKAHIFRIQLRDGIDPLVTREAARLKAATESLTAITFKECAERYVVAHSSSWKNAKHAAQWTNTLKTYALPILGDLSIASIDTDLVLKVLEPIWTTKAETASRIRGRIEAVLDWATARKLRAGENPARWRGHLNKLLPARSKSRTVQHHPALPYAEIPVFMTALRAQDGTAARALEIAVLTAARTNEVINAKWGEISFSDSIWTIPRERMKTDRSHRIPLSAATLLVLKAMKEVSSDFVFPGGKHEREAEERKRVECARRDWWRPSIHAAGTLAQVYLESREIKVPIPPSLRYLPNGKHSGTGLSFPCLVAAITGLDRRVTGVHRTYLRADGRGKAGVSLPKQALGIIGTGSVHLAPVKTEIGLAEGIETALSAMQLFKVPTWAACGSWLERVAIPETVSRVIIFADCGVPGELAAERALKVHHAAGRIVDVRFPAGGGDWNDELQRLTKGGAA
jgi:integrase